MWVKVCGVRSAEQAVWAQQCGADAVGFNLHPRSPRSVTPQVAAEIAAAVDISTVLVVVDRSEEELGALVDQIDPTHVQLHGHEPPGFGAWLGTPVIKAFRAHPQVLDEIRAWGLHRFLLDAHVPGVAGGTGKRVDEALAREAAALGELILAGGLTPENVAERVARIRPWGVDVASGVESSPGTQDPERVRAFIHAARSNAHPA